MGTIGLLPQGAPLIPSEEVKAVIANAGLTQSDVATFFKVFLRARHHDGNKSVEGKLVISASSILILAAKNKDHWEVLLKNILQLGGCYEFLDWSHFLFVFVRFCSLSKVELCQLLFLIIVRELKGLEVHYLTSTQLDRFYDNYRVKDVPLNMDCSKIRFSNFPLSRYYVTDFVEMCYLYSPLIYPLQSLQRKYQNSLPSLRFWDEYSSVAGSTRKITLDFFLLKKKNVQLSGDTTFQETCDLLLLSSHLVHERLRERKIGENGEYLNRSDHESSRSPLESRSNSKALAKRAERWLEMDFLSRNRKVQDESDFKVERIYKKMSPNALLINNSSSGP
jgi:hypothetical protein